MNDKEKDLNEIAEILKRNRTSLPIEPVVSFLQEACAIVADYSISYDLIYVKIIKYAERFEDVENVTIALNGVDYSRLFFSKVVEFMGKYNKDIKHGFKKDRFKHFHLSFVVQSC